MNLDQFKQETPPEGKEQLFFCSEDVKLKRKSALLSRKIYIESVITTATGIRLTHLQNSIKIINNRLNKIK